MGKVYLQSYLWRIMLIAARIFYVRYRSSACTR